MLYLPLVTPRLFHEHAFLRVRCFFKSSSFGGVCHFRRDPSTVATQEMWLSFKMDSVFNLHKYKGNFVILQSIGIIVSYKM